MFVQIFDQVRILHIVKVIASMWTGCGKREQLILNVHVVSSLKMCNNYLLTYSLSIVVRKCKFIIQFIRHAYLNI